jgi:hypothetical protein
MNRVPLARRMVTALAFTIINVQDSSFLGQELFPVQSPASGARGLSNADRSLAPLAGRGLG